VEVFGRVFELVGGAVDFLEHLQSVVTAGPSPLLQQILLLHMALYLQIFGGGAVDEEVLLLDGSHHELRVAL